MSDDWKLINGVWVLESHEYDVCRPVFQTKIEGFKPDGEKR